MSYKEAMQNPNDNVKEQNEKLGQLEGSAHRAEELQKVNTNLVTELTALRKQIDQVKANAIAKFQTSKPYFDELGVQYGDRFKDFHKQATFLFLAVDFSQVQVDSPIPMTPYGEDVPDEEETNLGGIEATTPVVDGTDGQGGKRLTDIQLSQPSQHRHMSQLTTFKLEFFLFLLKKKKYKNDEGSLFLAQKHKKKHSL